MPGLRAFGRLWSVASDDFVFPAVLEICINCSWLVAVSAIYMTHDTSATCLGGRELQTYVLGCCVLLIVSLPVLLMLAMSSGRGAVMQTRKRRLVTPLLYCRLALLLVSCGWDVTGSIWLSDDIRQCDVTQLTVQVIIGLVVCNWVKTIAIVCGVAVVFDPLGSVSLSGGYSAASRRKSALRRHLWQKRCRYLCCCLHTDDTAQALRDVASHMATLVGESDLVPSDVVAGLILLQHRHAVMGVARQPSPVPPDGPPVSNADRPDPTPAAPRPPWMAAARACHYMRFALGVYGWPWFVHGRLTSAAGPLWRRVVCCAPCRAGSLPSIGDNCCLCNTAALQECTEVDARDLLHVSFVNKLYQVAYAVALDHRSESVVVAIRGTLSITDALTDLCLDSVLVYGEERPADRAHKGMLQSARNVLNSLEDSGVLASARRMYPAYDLVITGHSLGAGAASLLALLLRPNHPQLKCFAFSPPGGLVSSSLSSEMQAYVMSVVCGDDLVPRLSVSAVERLKTEMEEALMLCPLSKHALLYKACCNCACGAEHDLVAEDETNASADDHERPLVENMERSNYESLADAAERVVIADLRAQYVPLFLPGHVMHIRSPAPPSVAEHAWVSVDAFSSIHVTARMFADHLPDYVAARLRQVAGRSQAEEERRWEYLMEREGEWWGGRERESSGGENQPLFSSC